MYRSKACSVCPVCATGRHGHWDTQIDLLVLWRLSEAICHSLLRCTSVHHTNTIHAQQMYEDRRGVRSRWKMLPSNPRSNMPTMPPSGPPGTDRRTLLTCSASAPATTRVRDAGDTLPSPAPSGCPVVVVFRSTDDGVLEQRHSFGLIARSRYRCL